MSNYIYIYQGNAKDKMNLFADFDKLDNVKCLPTKRKQVKNKILKYLQDVYLSYTIAKIIRLPFKCFMYDLSEMDINDNDNYTIIMVSNVFFDFDISIIKKISKKKNVKLVLILLDSLDVDTPSARLIRKIYKYSMWNYIFTYDLNDAEKYGFMYLNEHYYSVPQIKEDTNILYDAYFFGALKQGRKQKIIELFKKLKNNNVNARFDIVKNNQHNFNYKDENFFVYEKKQKYIDGLKNTIHANCIIELLQENQKAQSLRYFEAVVFNKKLLTSNENIKKLSFYDKRYMKVFKNLEDIDFDWVNKKEEIDYNYKNEFSPIYIIEELEKIQKSEF